MKDATSDYLQEHLDWQKPSLTSVIAVIGAVLIFVVGQEKDIFVWGVTPAPKAFWLLGIFAGLAGFNAFVVHFNYERAQVAANYLIKHQLLDAAIAGQMRIIGGSSVRSRWLLMIVPAAVIFLILAAVIFDPKINL